MDLESECSALEFLEDNEATQRAVPHVDDDKFKNKHVDDYKTKDNGSCSNDDQTRRFPTDPTVDSDALTADNYVKGTAEIVQPMHSPPLAAKSPGGSSKCSALEFVEDKGATQHAIPYVDDDKFKNKHVDDYNTKDNGLCPNDNQTQRFPTDPTVDFDALTADNHVKGTSEIVQPMHSPPLAAKSPGGSSQCSALEFVEDKEATQHAIPHVADDKFKNKHVDDYKTTDNGSCSNDNQTQRLATDLTVDSDALTAHNHVKGTAEIVQPIHSPPLAAKSPGGSSPSTTKGYGLKKWRRIKRDFVKDATATVDSSKILKRGLTGSANPTKPQHRASPEIKQNIAATVGPVNILKNSNLGHGFMIRSPSSDSRFAVGAALASATDSENSEDQSSKSSTAASMPKVRYDLPGVSGYLHEKNQMNLSGNSVDNSSQRVQQGKGRIENSKKARGVRVKIEKENSHSSIESDSRSSNFVFMQGPFLVTSNGKQSGNTMNYNGENSDEAHEGEHQLNEEVQTAYKKENSVDIEELSPDDLAAGENHRPSTDQDPLVKSILALQSVQEAFENEVRKLGEVGKETLRDGSVNINSFHVDSTFADEDLHDQLASEKIRYLETQVFTLTQKVKYSESKLEEARAVLQVKESRISELETSANSSKSPKEESGSTAEMQQDRYREMEFDLEGRFQQKMEAEIQFLVLTRAVEKLRVAVGKQITLFEEQTLLAGEQAQMLNKLGVAESKAVAVELEKDHGDVLATEEVLKMPRKVCKVTSIFLTQLVLLVLVFLFLVLQLSSHSGVVVPT